jgi:hypothetical protein
MICGIQWSTSIGSCQVVMAFSVTVNDVFVSVLDYEKAALFSSQNILQNFLHSSSHRILRHMHEALNINKRNN